MNRSSSGVLITLGGCHHLYDLELWWIIEAPLDDYAGALIRIVRGFVLIPMAVREEQL